MKIYAKEFKEFYNDDGFWPDDDDTCIEGVTALLNGHAIEDINEIGDMEEVTIGDGVVVSQDSSFDEKSLEFLFEKWRVQRKKTFFLVSCNTSEVEAIRNLLEEKGCDVSYE